MVNGVECVCEIYESSIEVLFSLCCITAIPVERLRLSVCVSAGPEAFLVVIKKAILFSEGSKSTSDHCCEDFVNCREKYHRAEVAYFRGFALIFVKQAD